MFGIQGGLVNGRRSILHLLRMFLGSPWYTALGIFKSNRGMKGYLIEDWARQLPDRYRDDLSALFELAAAGSMAPQTDEILPMSRVVEAHQRINIGSQIGKIILDPTCSLYKHTFDKHRYNISQIYKIKPRLYNSSRTVENIYILILYYNYFSITIKSCLIISTSPFKMFLVFLAIVSLFKDRTYYRSEIIN